VSTNLQCNCPSSSNYNDSHLISMAIIFLASILDQSFFKRDQDFLLDQLFPIHYLPGVLHLMVYIHYLWDSFCFWALIDQVIVVFSVFDYLEFPYDLNNVCNYQSDHLLKNFGKFEDQLYLSFLNVRQQRIPRYWSFVYLISNLCRCYLLYLFGTFFLFLLIFSCFRLAIDYFAFLTYCSPR
jgi:hypothetical protein